MRQDGKAGLSSTRPIIRKYSPADLEVVCAICQHSPEAAQWHRDSYNQAISSGQTILVAEVAEQVLGFVVVRVASGEAEILNMAVDAAERRKGMGNLLLTAAMIEVRAQHAQRVYLEVRESNLAGMAFYEKHGFRKTGNRPGYYREPTENAVLMERKLTG